MKDKLFGVFAVMAIAGTIVAAQDPQPPAPSPSPSPMSVPQSPSRAPSVAQPEDESLTGCLVQGSGPTVFLLENAKMVADVGTVEVTPGRRGCSE